MTTHGLNSEFSISYIGCLTKVKEPCATIYTLLSEEELD